MSKKVKNHPANVIDVSNKLLGLLGRQTSAPVAAPVKTQKERLIEVLERQLAESEEGIK